MKIVSISGTNVDHRTDSRRGRHWLHSWPSESGYCKEYTSNYRKLATKTVIYSLNNNTSNEDKHDTNYINNKYNDTNPDTRKLHNL